MPDYRTVAIPAQQPYSAREEAHRKRPQDEELQQMMQYIRGRGYRGPVTVENSNARQDPLEYAQRILRNGLDGWDYISAEGIFEADGVTPTANLQRLQQATALLQPYLAARRR